MKKVPDSIPYFYRQTFLFACFLFNSIWAFEQMPALDNIKGLFTKYHSKTLQEKIYIHTDKSFYLVDEIIWFKVYNVDATFHKPVDAGKIVYVEILDKENKIVLHSKIAMENGTGSGSFVLTSSLSTGNYIVRAYTSWMKNFDSRFYFEKEITVINSLKKVDWHSLEKQDAFDIQFFPEGGNLVYGIESRIAFRAIDQYGKGVDCKGYLLDKNNDTVSRFHSLYFGMGSFYFTPQTGNRYKAVMVLNKNIILNGSLPAIYEKGYVMKVQERDSGHLVVQVNFNESVGTGLYLFIHTRQLIRGIIASQNKSGSTEFIIDKKILADGISHFTLFNDNRQPLCERLYFKKPDEKLILDLKSDKEKYGLRTKVNLDLYTHDEDGNPLNTDLSVSVYLLDSLQHLEQTDIINYLWLTSDLRGTIESPDFYFNRKGQNIDEALDNLMLTHGWSRFKWEDILSDHKPSVSFLPEYEGHIIAGKIVDRKTGNPLKGQSAWLAVPGKKFHFSNAVSNDTGEVYFVVKDIYGPNELVVQTDTIANSNSRIDILNPYSNEGAASGFSRFSLSEKWKDQLIFHSINSQVQQAFETKDQQLYFLPGSKDSSEFYSEPDSRYILDDYTRFPTMEEVMREFVNKVRVRKEEGRFHFQVLNTPYKSYFDSDPLVLMDGVPVFNTDKIVAFDPLKVKSIDVIARTYFYGNKLYHGIISYSTYEGNLANFELDPGSTILEYDGLQLLREFYSPAYDLGKNVHSPLPDRRNVLFWSPDCRTDQRGRGQVSFYTSDLPGNYAIVIQGINSKGYAVKTVKFIEVIK